MALIKCPECGKEILDQATSCPNCGTLIKSGRIYAYNKLIGLMGTIKAFLK